MNALTSASFNSCTRPRNGLLIAFTMSLDDFVISYFTAGSSVQTLSMTIYAMTRRRISPKINAISTLIFAVYPQGKNARSAFPNSCLSRTLSDSAPGWLAVYRAA